MNQHIVEYLNYYVNLKNPQYAVLLKGSWGSGKTFFIKKLIENWKNDEVPDSSEDSIKLKPFYVSLNGISKISSINEKLRAEINPILYSKGAKVAKSVFKFITKAALRFDVDTDNDDNKDGSVSFDLDSLGIFKAKNENVKGKRILIFDDLERCKLPTDEIFGYINDYVEHSECKVIILTDEQKIIDKYTDESEQTSKEISKVSYKDFKEKLIGQTFEVESDTENAIDFFISQSEIESDNKDLSSNRDLIVSIFITSELKNLRVLKQGLFDFGRFIKNIDEEYSSHTQYDEFVKNLITYFIIVYAELKTGNEDVKEFQSFMILLDNTDLSVNEIKLKYQAIMSEHNILHSSKVFPIGRIADYIENGIIDKTEFNTILSNNHFFKPISTELNWSDLWAWPHLQDEEFSPLVKKIWKEFYDGKIYDVRVLFHIVGIFIELIDEGLLNKTERYLKIRANQIMKTIFENDSSITYHQVFNAGRGAFQKQYRNYDHAIFINLKAVFQDLLNNSQLEQSDLYINKIFADLNSNSIDELYTLLKEPIPDGTNLYERTPYFSNIDATNLAKRVKSFDNRGIYMFKEFIHYRYNPSLQASNRTLEDYHKLEQPFLVEFKKELSKKNKKRDKIKNIAINKFDVELESIITNLNNYKCT